MSMHFKNGIAALIVCLLAAPLPAAESDTKGAIPESGPVVIKTGAGKSQVSFWLESSLKRVFPHSQPGNAKLRLLAARNSRIAFQACLKSGQTEELTAECRLEGAEDLKPRIRYVGLVPMHHLTAGTPAEELDGVEHLPGLVPDPLWPLTSVNSIGLNESRSFWITLNIPKDATPGPRELTVRLSSNGGKQTVKLPVTLEISEFVVQARKNFPVTHWWRGEATWDYYKTGMFDQRWWDITRAQMANMLDHGSDVVYVPMFFNRRELFSGLASCLLSMKRSPGNTSSIGRASNSSLICAGRLDLPNSNGRTCGSIGA